MSKLLEENEMATRALVICCLLVFMFILRSSFGVPKTEAGVINVL